MHEMKNSGVDWIGEIPVTWQLYKMKYLGKYINGFPFKPDDWGNAGKPIIRIQDLTGTNKEPNYFEGELDSKYLVADGDILVSWAATLDAFEWKGGESWLNQHIFKAIPNTDIVEKAFFIWLLKTSMKHMNDDNKHGIVMQHVTLPVFNNFIVALPSHVEQKRLSATLCRGVSRVDSLIANQEAQIKKLKAYKQSLITEVVTKGLDPTAPMKDSGVEWIGEIPAHWSIMPSKYLFANSDERRRDNDVQLTASQKYGMISQEEYMRRENARIVLADKGLENWKHIEPFDFVISLRSFQGGLEMSEVTGCATWHYIVLRARKELHPYYYKWLFKSTMYITALQRTCNYIRDGQDLRYSNFVKVSLCVPTLGEQVQIANYLDAKCAKIERLIAIKQAKIEKLEQYKKSLIYEYVTGKKEVVNG